MAKLNRADIIAQIDLLINDNNNKEITALDVRTVLKTISQSDYNLIDDDALEVFYDPTEDLDWDAVIPTEAMAALDQLAKRMRILETNNASPNVAYVSTTGSDVIGEFELGNPLKPYATFEKAFLDVPASNFIIQSLGGTFTETFTIDTPNSKTNFIFRLDGTIVNGVDTRQGPIEDWNGSRTGYYFKKFMDPYTPASWPNDLQKVDAPYVRYTEILLNYVEANINLGDEGEAKAWLNRLRFRNGLPEVTASGSDLVEVYKRERDKELVNEDARLYDMKRWLEGPYSLDKQVQQILIQATQKSGSGMTPANYQKSSSDFEYVYRPTDIVFENRVWKDQVYFMPIPQAEIDRDPSIQQNPGY